MSDQATLRFLAGLVSLASGEPLYRQLGRALKTAIDESVLKRGEIVVGDLVGVPSISKL